MTAHLCAHPDVRSAPSNWGGHYRKVGGTVKKIFRRFAPEFVPPTFNLLPAPMDDSLSLTCSDWTPKFRIAKFGLKTLQSAKHISSVTLGLTDGQTVILPMPHLATLRVQIPQRGGEESGQHERRGHRCSLSQCIAMLYLMSLWLVSGTVVVIRRSRR